MYKAQLRVTVENIFTSSPSMTRTNHSLSRHNSTRARTTLTLVRGSLRRQDHEGERAAKTHLYTHTYPYPERYTITRYHDNKGAQKGGGGRIEEVARALSFSLRHKRQEKAIDCSFSSSVAANLRRDRRAYPNTIS